MPLPLTNAVSAWRLCVYFLCAHPRRPPCPLYPGSQPHFELRVLFPYRCTYAHAAMLPSTERVRMYRPFPLTPPCPLDLVCWALLPPIVGCVHTLACVNPLLQLL